MKMLLFLRNEILRSRPIKGIAFLGIYSIFVGAEISAQATPANPILRIETGAHENRILRLSVDAKGMYLVTASEDKTARVWDLTTGALLNTLRPPIGNDHEGKIYSAAVSPDGNFVAAGGWTGYEWDKTNCIYIFDRESGRIVRRVTGFPHVIQHIRYSPNGRHLAAYLGESGGIRLYETENFQKIGEDRDYTVRGEFISFNSTGRMLVTSSFDKYLRLYEVDDESGLRLIKKREVGDGIPVGLSFSPNDASIAVGFADALKVSVVSAFDLSERYEADLRSTSNGELSLVAWSQDSSVLYAIGRIGSRRTGINSISLLKNNGRSLSELPATIGSVYDLIPLPNGGVAFSTANPAAWGTLDVNGQRRIYVDSKASDFNRTVSGIFLNDSGTRIKYSNQRGEGTPMIFSLAERRLETEKTPQPDLKPPPTKSSRMAIDGWSGSGTNPTLNGNSLQLTEFENSHSLAILPDEKSFLLGSGWYLRRYNNKGQELWRIQTPSNARSVNVDARGKIAVVILGDGTIRWYRTSDGAELLAFFAPTDQSGRWILWTPSGYYDASPGAEDLIGWHVNNGGESAADFFPNHIFRDYFYRPDIISGVLDTVDESQAVTLANKKANRSQVPLSIAKILPPVVEFDLPEVEAPMDGLLKLSYRIRNHSREPLTSINALIDGRAVPVKIDKKLSTENGRSEVIVQLPKNTSQVMLIAENRFTRSMPAKINIKWKAGTIARISGTPDVRGCCSAPKRIHQ